MSNNKGASLIDLVHPHLLPQYFVVGFFFLPKVCCVVRKIYELCVPLAPS